MIQIISVLGCGWFGLPLAKTLQGQGYHVKGSTTTSDKLALLDKHSIKPFLIDLQETGTKIDPDFFDCDVLVVSIPPKRSSGQQDSYPAKIEQIRKAAVGRSKNVIFISSTSVYGDENDAIDETSLRKPDTASGIAMVDAEDILLKEKIFHTSVIRFAGLVGPGRNPGRFFAGKTDIPNGQAPINLIHLIDCIQLTVHLIRQNAFGHVFNGCSPDHPQKQHFYTHAAEASGLPSPHFIDEIKSWKMIQSEKSSTVLNYKYVIDNWSDWIDKDMPEFNSILSP